MALSVGTSLGNYEVTGSLGAGGMGEVYRARDTKLERDVAIKVLPQAFADDADRMARFEREAKLLAGLNHPNIATLHGLEDVDGTHFLVMELVSGESLADRLARGALSLDETLAIARQVADALEAAHEKGIIHRDLKPGNVQITPDDVVKVLDFGLAKAMTDDTGSEVDLSASPTMTRDATQVGVILGTAAYMSPEQARGKPVDRRADVFAFGCVLYEMLSGKKAFSGETVSDILAAVLKTEPAWSALPATTPPVVEKLVRRCLEKNPKLRLRDFGDAGLEIRDATVEPAKRVAQPRSVATIVVAAAAAFALAWGLSHTLDRSPAPSVQRFTVTIPPELANERAGGKHLTLSPNGDELLMHARRDEDFRIFRRPLDRFSWTEVDGTTGGRNPMFSPDCASIGFRLDWELYTVDRAGGPASFLTDVRTDDPHWADDGFVYFTAMRPEILRMPASGGEAEIVIDDVPLTPGDMFSRVHKIAGADAVLVTHNIQFSDDMGISLVNFESGEVSELIENGQNPRYLPSGHLVFARDEALHAVAFDVDSLSVIGRPRPVVENVQVEIGGAAQFATSTNGTLAYVTAFAQSPARIMRVNRRGEAVPLSEHVGTYRGPALSPDGNQLAMMASDDQGRHIWLLDTARDTLSRATFDGDNHDAVWSPDGAQLAVMSYVPRGIFVTAPNRRREEGTMLTMEGRPSPGSWLPDGSGLLFATHDILKIEFDAPDAIVPVMATSDVETSPVLSPNGRFLAYVSFESETWEVYVVGFPELSPRWQISSSGGLNPRWSRDGTELYYRNGNALMAVGVSPNGSLDPGRPEVLFERPFATDAIFRPAYDVTPDGDFITLEPAGSGETPHIQIVLNWFEELKELVPPP